MKKFNKNNEDFRDIEIASLRGNLEATKHYYAILIAKNVARVEDVVRSLSSDYDGYEEEEESTLQLLRTIEKRKKKMSRSIKKLLEECQQELLKYQHYKKHVVENYKSIINELRQVL